MSMNKVHFSSASSEWETPDELFQQLDKRFNFDIDVCASPDNTKCLRYWTKEDDCLKQDWRGLRCWMNPPYGRGIGKFIEKAKYSGAAVVVCLLPARTDSWFLDYIWNERDQMVQASVDLAFIRGRLQFKGAPHKAPFPSMIVIFWPLA